MYGYDVYPPWKLLMLHKSLIHQGSINYLNSMVTCWSLRDDGSMAVQGPLFWCLWYHHPPMGGLMAPFPMWHPLGLGMYIWIWLEPSPWTCKHTSLFLWHMLQIVPKKFDTFAQSPIDQVVALWRCHDSISRLGFASYPDNSDNPG